MKKILSGLPVAVCCTLLQLLLNPVDSSALAGESHRSVEAVSGDILNKAPRHTHEDMAAKIEQGHNEYEKGNYEEALQLLQEVAQAEPENALASYYTGLTYQGMLDYEEAGKYFARAVELDPGMGNSWAHLGEMMYRLKRYEDAKKVLENAIPNGARPAYAHYINGLVMMELKAYGEAITAFQKAEKIDPGYHQQTTYGIGMVYMRLHKKKAASQAFREAIAINPKSVVGVYATFGLQDINRPEARSWHVNAGYHLQYDSNVVLNPGGTSSAVLPTGQRDFVHVLDLNGYFVPKIKGPVAVRLDGNYYKSLHNKLTYMDLDGLDLAITPSMAMGAGTLSVGIRQDMYWVAGRSYMYIYGAYPGYSFAVGKNQQGMLNAGYQKKRYFHQVLAFPGENRNASNYSVGYTHYAYFDDHRGYAQLGYMFDVEDTRGRNWDYRGNRLTASLHAPALDGVELQLYGDYYLQNYRNVHNVHGVKRRDTTMTVAPMISYTYNKWLELQLQYSYTRAVSNIGVYSYSRHVAGVGFEINY